MSKYTLEEVSARLRRAAKLELETSIPRGSVEWLDMAHAIDALLRERESTKAAVTDEMIERAARAMCRKFDPPSSLDEMATCDKWRRFADEARCCLEAVVPMPANAHANQEPYCYTVEQKNGLSQGAMCRTKAECEASSMFDPDIDHVIPLYREPVLASVRVPDGWQLVPINPTDEMIEKGTDQHECSQGDSWYTDLPISENDCNAIYKAMLAAAPKPETEE